MPSYKKIIAFTMTLMLPILCQATNTTPQTAWSIDDIYLGAYPDSRVTITGGNGTITQTEVSCYQTSSDCTTGFLTFSILASGNPFTYTSGNVYKANLARKYSSYNVANCQSTTIRITDGLGATATSGCLAVSCASNTDCTFTPSTTSITF